MAAALLITLTAMKSLFFRSGDQMTVGRVRDTGLKQMTLEEYENARKSTTQRELEALYSSDAFKAMKKAKGDKPQNWNWQTEEVEARKSRE